MRFLWLPLSFPCSSFHMDACVLFFWQSKIKIVFILKWDWVICILTKKEQVNNCIPAHRITGASWPWKTTNYYLNSIKYCIFPRGTSDPQTNVKSLLLFVHCWLFKIFPVFSILMFSTGLHKCANVLVVTVYFLYSTLDIFLLSRSTFVSHSSLNSLIFPTYIFYQILSSLYDAY